MSNRACSRGCLEDHLGIEKAPDLQTDKGNGGWKSLQAYAGGMDGWRLQAPIFAESLIICQGFDPKNNMKRHPK